MKNKVYNFPVKIFPHFEEDKKRERIWSELLYEIINDLTDDMDMVDLIKFRESME